MQKRKKIENGKRTFDYKKLDLIAQNFNIDINELKNEYFSEKIAYELILNNCSEDEVLLLAEQKIHYFKSKLY